nr:hypothetical protein Itr_chr13CG16300 [Ipomoea trifida]
MDICICLSYDSMHTTAQQHIKDYINYGDEEKDTVVQQDSQFLSFPHSICNRISAKKRETSERVVRREAKRLVKLWAMAIESLSTTSRAFSISFLPNDAVRSSPFRFSASAAPST